MATSYTVQKGDTLGAIAKRFGTNIGNLSGFRSGNVDLIYPGEIITIKTPVDTEASNRASTIRNELGGSTSTTKTPKLDDTLSGFLASLQTNLADSKKKRDEAFTRLENFRTNRYNDLIKGRNIDAIKEEVRQLDDVITQKKNERDALIAQIRKNPGASASTLTGEVAVATDKLNAEINNLIGQRNSKANEYNSTLAEIDSIVGREARDLENSLGFFDKNVRESQDLIDAYQKTIIDELRRQEDRKFDLEDDLRDFEQALELARIREGAGTNYTILTDQFGRPTVAIDRKNPTVQIDLSETNGSLPKSSVDPALLQSILNQQKKKNEKGFFSGIKNFLKGIFN